MHQGRVGFKSPMGRPAAGPLSTFPRKLQETILHLRKLHPGWGPNTRLAADPRIEVEDSQLAGKLSILGALTLYLDFLNLFLFLLRIFGRSSD